MKLLAISIYGNGILLNRAKDLSSVGYFIRKNVSELIDFTCSTLVDNVRSDTIITKDNYNVHLVVHCNRTVCIVTDDEYPSDVARRLAQNILSTTDPNLEDLLRRGSDPNEIDSMHSIRTELDETRQVIKKNIELVLQRGTNLDALVAQSEELSFSSKAFYQGTRKINSNCCNLQ